MSLSFDAGRWFGAPGGGARSAPSVTAGARLGQAGRIGLLGMLGLLAVPDADARAGDPKTAIEVVAIRPDEQVRAVLALFEGTPWPHPASALVDWKRSAKQGERRSLGKPMEAMISAINPLMARELATLDGARLRLTFPSGADSEASWSLVVPGDDGTIAALATAMALTDGESMPPEETMRVDRIGPPGAPLLATGGPGEPTVLASDREALGAAIRLGLEGNPEAAGPDSGSGWMVRIDSEAMARGGSVAARRMAEGLIGLGYGVVRARASLEGESLRVVADRPGPRPVDRVPSWGTIDPKWLDPVPIGRASAVVSVAIGPGGDAWAGAIGVADRIDRAGSDREGLAPLRQRLALFALARGIRLEADLWPVLEGVTLWVSMDESGEPDAGLIALHAGDEDGAGRIADRVVARIEGEENAPGGPRLESARRGASVLLGWGDGTLSESLSAADDPSNSLGPVLRKGWGREAPSRFGAVWPGRLPWVGQEGALLRESLAEGPPIVWLGWDGDGKIRDEVRWDGLKAPVRRFLDRLPAEPTESGRLPIRTGEQP